MIDYSAWLWYFGHTLSPWGAFTVKPFMPTVFGEGKVAQFSTFSYPTYGFGCCCVVNRADPGGAVACATLISQR